MYGLDFLLFFFQLVLPQKRWVFGVLPRCLNPGVRACVYVKQKPSLNSNKFISFNCSTNFNKNERTCFVVGGISLQMTLLQALTVKYQLTTD